MWGTEGTRRYNFPRCIKPEGGKVAKDCSKSSIKQSCRVFHDHVCGHKNANDSCELKPEATSFSLQAAFCPCIGYVLAGKPAANDINFPLLWIARRKRPHIVVPPHVRPVFGQHLAAVMVDLDLPATLHPGTFKAKIKTRRCRRTNFQTSARHPSFPVRSIPVARWAAVPA